MSYGYSLGFGLALLIASLATGTAQAQQISRTSDYTLSWSGSAFSGASTLYAASNAYGANPFTDNTYTLTLNSDAANLSLQESGGVTISSPALTPPTPYPASYVVTYSGNGTDGAWGWTYNTAVPLTYGTLGTLPTLSFFGGGGQDTPGADSPFDYYVYVYLPGDWTTEGTLPGDYNGVSVGSGFSAPTFSYLGGVTTVFTSNLSFTGGDADLAFTLVGSAVPEPSTWAMLIVGFAGLGFAGYRKVKSGRPILAV